MLYKYKFERKWQTFDGSREFAAFLNNKLNIWGFCMVGQTKQEIRGQIICENILIALRLRDKRAINKGQVFIMAAYYNTATNNDKCVLYC